MHPECGLLETRRLIEQPLNEEGFAQKYGLREVHRPEKRRA